MLFKRTRLGQIYIRVLTHTSLFFILYVLLGVTLLIHQAIKTQIPVYCSYVVHKKNSDSDGLEYRVNLDSYTGRGFIYTNKNDSVIAVLVKDSVIAVNDTLTSVISNSDADELYIDITTGYESLLKRVFQKGGKSYGDH